ncbi:hypothetical protein, partial [Pseudomonas aeruginosa]|uniref:hypothetical protein n=1 Tax=Pseudomonas aeruginosa TaxID=287 RepID=UPI001ABD065A
MRLTLREQLLQVGQASLRGLLRRLRGRHLLAGLVRRLANLFLDRGHAQTFGFQQRATLRQRLLGDALRQQDRLLPGACRDKGEIHS